MSYSTLCTGQPQLLEGFLQSATSSSSSSPPRSPVSTRKNSNYWAGGAFCNSPPPSSLPKPDFNVNSRSSSPTNSPCTSPQKLPTTSAGRFSPKCLEGHLYEQQPFLTQSPQPQQPQPPQFPIDSASSFMPYPTQFSFQTSHLPTVPLASPYPTYDYQNHLTQLSSELRQLLKIAEPVY